MLARQLAVGCQLIKKPNSRSRPFPVLATIGKRSFVRMLEDGQDDSQFHVSSLVEAARSWCRQSPPVLPLGARFMNAKRTAGWKLNLSRPTARRSQVEH